MLLSWPPYIDPFAVLSLKFQLMPVLSVFETSIEKNTVEILISRARNIPFDDESFVDELFENTRKGLLRYLENIQQFRDLQAGIAVDEVQHAMMCPAEAVLRQDGVGIAGKIAVGEIEKLDAGDKISRRELAAAFSRRRRTLRRNTPY